jgi:hypothetical protein
MNATQCPGAEQSRPMLADCALSPPAHSDHKDITLDLKRRAKRVLGRRFNQLGVQPVVLLSAVTTMMAVERVTAIGLELAENKDNSPKDRVLGGELVIRSAKAKQHLAEQALRLERNCRDNHKPKNLPPDFSEHFESEESVEPVT